MRSEVHHGHFRGVSSKWRLESFARLACLVAKQAKRLVCLLAVLSCANLLGIFERIENEERKKFRVGKRKSMKGYN